MNKISEILFDIYKSQEGYNNLSDLDKAKSKLIMGYSEDSLVGSTKIYSIGDIELFLRYGSKFSLNNYSLKVPTIGLYNNKLVMNSNVKLDILTESGLYGLLCKIFEIRDKCIKNNLVGSVNGFDFYMIDSVVKMDYTYTEKNVPYIIAVKGDSIKFILCISGIKGYKIDDVVIKDFNNEIKLILGLFRSDNILVNRYSLILQKDDLKIVW